jgi:diguanylate cyclase (GGDEF)-like protein/PAS domain S-box-containing protein
MTERLNLLVLEESDVDFSALDRYLRNERADCQVERVTSVAGLSDAAARPWDAVLLGWPLAGVQLGSLPNLIERYFPETPALLLAGQVGEERVADLLRAGINGYVNKEGLGRLLPAIRSALRDAASGGDLRRLEARVERYRMLVETAQDWIWEVDAEGRYTYCNSYVHQLLGYEPAELIGKKPFDLMPDDEADRVRELFMHRVASREPITALENTNLHRDGRLVILETSGRPVFDQDGQLLGYRGIDRDITERKRAECALRESERRLRDAQAYARIGYWELNLATGKALWSEETRDIAGVGPHEEPSLAMLSRLMHPDDFPVFERSLREAIKSKREHHVEYRIRRLDDEEERWLECRGRPETDANCVVVRVLGVVQDITERKRVEEKLRQSATVFENTTEGVFITDAAGNILDVNRAFVEITGFEPREVIGNNPRMWKSGHHDEDFYRALWSSVRMQGQWRGEIWNRRKTGRVFPEWLTISAVYDSAGRLTNYVAVFSDISSIKSSQERLEHLAHHDPLTDLPNRLLLHARLEHGIRHASRTQTLFGVVFIDLDRFKRINDSFGHTSGDKLLRAVGERLVLCVRLEDTVARIGGDEFAILVEGLRSEHDACVVADKLLHAFGQPFEIEDREVHVTLSIGVSIYPRDGDSGPELLRNADAAMYRAKDEGRNNYQLYTRALTSDAYDRAVLETRLRTAQDNHELRVFYQPQIDLRVGRVTGVEALVRWRHPELGPVPPEKFVRVAEECGLIRRLGEWVLRTACQHARLWQLEGLEFGRVGINVAGAQLQWHGFAARVEEILDETSLPAGLLELEVNEDFLMREAERGISELEALRSLGVTLAIDDFGTGYSSLSYLKRLPVHRLKIDRSFVHDIPDDLNSLTITRAIIALGNRLRLEVVAEGVETAAQEQFLLEAGCHQAQGFRYLKPTTYGSMTAWLQENARVPGRRCQ